ncbi:MAG TPA: hypothetical protein VG097_02465 [Gemmata sp.]|nr:hypothetical protein [Gemmata sp.]
MYRIHFTTTFALSCVTCCALCGVAPAQQPAVKMDETEIPTFLVAIEKNGAISFEEKKLDPALVIAMKPDPNDSPIRKLQRERCRERAIYLAKVNTLIAIGKSNPQDFLDYLKLSATLTENLQELVDKPAAKLKCLEMRVELLKTGEKFIETRVLVGSDPSQNLNAAKAARLDAEIDLLKFKAEIDRPNSMTVIASAPQPLPMWNPSAAWTYPAAVWSPSTGWTYPAASWSPVTGWTFPPGYPIPGRIFLGGR